MKKAFGAVIAVAVLLAVLSGSLLSQRNAEHEKMEVLCQISAARALEEFRSYQKSQTDSDYLSGVAEFRSFMTAYLFLQDNVSNPEYLWCNTVYGDMVLHPERVQADMQGLVEGLEFLSQDYTSHNGFLRISNYAHQLTYGS